MKNKELVTKFKSTKDYEEKSKLYSEIYDRIREGTFVRELKHIGLIHECNEFIIYSKIPETSIQSELYKTSNALLNTSKNIDNIIKNTNVNEIFV